MIIKPEIFSNKGIQSLQTTRIGGHSNKPYDSMNFGCFSGDPHVESNLSLLSQKYDLPHLPVFMQQVHGNQIVEYTDVPNEHGHTSADGCFTRKPNIICAILTADCLPVLLADKSATMVAAIHCGWRSLHADILGKAIGKFGIEPSELSCWLGPCISYQPYRVDEEFRQRFVNKNPHLAHCFYQHKKTGWHADLKQIAVTQLNALNVKTIAQSPYCTHGNKSLFYSYRRDSETGRMASMIWLNPDISSNR